MNLLPFSTRVVCEGVCREWREASLTTTATCQTSLCFFSKKKFDVTHKAIQNFCTDQSHNISFHNDCVFADDNNILDVMKILSRCPNLRALHIRGFEEENLITEGIDTLSWACPKIEHLSLSDDTRGCYIYKDCLTLVKACISGLRHLQIRFPAEGTLDFLIENTILRKSLLMHAHTLESLATNLPLNSENCDIIANDCHLTKLSLQGTSATLEGLTMICTSPTQCLQDLTIVIDWNLQLDLLTEHLTNLESLRVTIANNEVTNLGCLSSLKNLKKLFLSVWTNNSVDDDILFILSGCKRLTSLSINGEVTDKSLSHLSEFCPQLETLEIALNSDPKSVSDFTLEVGLSQLPNLRHLALNHCNVTEDGLRNLLARNPNLEFIRLTVAENLTIAVLPILEEYASRRRRKGLKVVLPKKLVPPFGRRTSVSVVSPNLTLKFD